MQHSELRTVYYRRGPYTGGLAMRPIPEEFHTITPHLVVRGVARAVEFYQRAFGANELLRNFAPDGKSIMHSELLLGDSRFFVNDEFPQHGVLSPLALN